MDIEFNFTLRTDATTQQELEYIAKSINNTLEKRIAEVNYGIKNKTNAIISFEAKEVRRNSLFKVEFKFPDDLDNIKP